MAKIKITQVVSRIGSTARQKKNLDALGIKKMGRTVVHEASPIILGMVEKVKHLVKVEPAENGAETKAAKKVVKKAAPKTKAAPAAKVRAKAEPKAASKAAPKAKAASKAKEEVAEVVAEVEIEPVKED